MSEHENPRDRGSQSGQKQACLFQPKYDGGDNLGTGERRIIYHPLYEIR